MKWFRVPEWLGGRLKGDHVATEAEAWVDLLGRWSQGEAVSACEFQRATMWGKGRVLRFMAKVETWALENGAIVVRSKSDRKRTGSGPEADRAEVGDTPVIEDDRTGSGPEADRKRTDSRARVPLLERDVDRDVEITPMPGATAPLPPKWAALFPDEVTTTDAPPVAVVEPPKVKRTRATKAPTTDTHAREAIAAWCDAYSTGTGQPYTITAGDAGRLKRVAADYLTGEAWPEKLATLATGMATYIATPDRWPKGPPTVGGFCIDPQRWIAKQPANNPYDNPFARYIK